MERLKFLMMVDRITFFVSQHKQSTRVMKSYKTPCYMPPGVLTSLLIWARFPLRPYVFTFEFIYVHVLKYLDFHV